MCGLFFHFLFKLRDEAGTCGVGAGEEAAPLMRVSPERFSGFCVEDGEVCCANRRGFVIVGNGVFIDSAGFFDGACLTAGINDVAAFWRRSREHENEVSLSFVRENLETAPFFQFVERDFSDCRNGLRRKRFWRRGFVKRFFAVAEQLSQLERAVAVRRTWKRSKEVRPRQNSA